MRCPLARSSSAKALWGEFVEDHCVVESIDNLLLYNAFEVTKIDNHTIFHVVRIVDRFAYHRYVEFIAVSVQVFAFAIVAKERVSCLKVEFFSNANHSLGVRGYKLKRKCSE